MKAWWFDNNNGKLGHNDGREMRIGETHKVFGRMNECSNRLYGYIRILDALRYANSTILYRVNITGDIDRQSDKIAGRKRKYLYGGNVGHILRRFECDCALENIEKIKPLCSDQNYDLMVKFLTTVDEPLRINVYYLAMDIREAAWNKKLASTELAALSVVWASSKQSWAAADAAAISTVYTAMKGEWSEERRSEWSAARSAELERYNKKLESMIKEHFGENK